MSCIKEAMLLGLEPFAFSRALTVLASLLVLVHTQTLAKLALASRLPSSIKSFNFCLGNWFANTKRMSPLKETAKELRLDGFERDFDTASAKGKGKGKGKGKAHQEEELITGIQFLSLEASAQPRPQKPGSRHSKRVDYYLNQYHDEMAGQNIDEGDEGEQEEQEEQEEEKEEEMAGYPGVSERAEPLSRKRSFREAGFHPSDESESETLRVKRSRRNVPDWRSAR